MRPICAVPVALLLLATGCSQPAAPPRPGPLTELPRALSASEREILARSNAFGLELAAAVVARDARPNVVLSPLSASMALGMTLNGAAGETFDAMRVALGFAGLSQEEINDAYRSLVDLLTALDPDVRFEIANAIWTAEGIPFEEAFFGAVRAAFDASVASRDFADPATLEEINGWVEDRTEGSIDTILEEIPLDVVMLLLNAIYFDGTWTTRFDPQDTRKRPFTTAEGTRVEVDMMALRDVEVRRAVSEGYVAVELPYGREAFSMVVVLPTDDRTARELMGTLDEAAWARLVGSLMPYELDELALPKLTLSYDTYLNEALRALGMGTAFTPEADFSRLSPAGEEMCLDFVRQKTFVEVDERGTRAAAVAAVGIGTVSYEGFVVDRPFLFALRERLSGTILFLGLVEDPTAGEAPPGPYEDTCGL